ncbi:hypothetical protein [Streptomyces sp. DASNCL29]|uniref:hypothetical protein n=1 Tax=Streptomyces sp. DASNCL29 TaxID=2583819 RepID=UPI001486EF41|nr:hypothetical protein [Streptomyces sp. DASNCL29]
MKTKIVRVNEASLKSKKNALLTAAAAVAIAVGVTFLGAASASAVCMPTKAGNTAQ